MAQLVPPDALQLAQELRVVREERALPGLAVREHLLLLLDLVQLVLRLVDDDPALCELRPHRLEQEEDVVADRQLLVVLGALVVCLDLLGDQVRLRRHLALDGLLEGGRELLLLLLGDAVDILMVGRLGEGRCARALDDLHLLLRPACCTLSL